MAASLVGAAAVSARDPATMISVLQEGVAPRDGYGVMPSFRDALSDREIADVVNYVRTSWGNDAPPNAHSGAVASIRARTDTAENVRAAVVCPNIPIDNVAPPLRDRLRALATQPEPEIEAVQGVVASYREARPAATRSERVVDLSSVYCQALASDGVERDEVTRKLVRFMTMVGEEK